MGPRAVAAGVDTLELWTRAPVRLEVAEALRGLRAEAKRTGNQQPFDVGNVAFEVAGHGAAGADYLLSADTYALKLAPGAREGECRARVEVRSVTLWAMGWRRAAHAAEELLMLVTEGELKTQCGRVDLCCDVQGWTPGPADLDILTTRVQRSGRASHFGAAWAMDTPDYAEEHQAEVDAEVRRLRGLMQTLEAAVRKNQRAAIAQHLREIQNASEHEAATTYGDKRAFSGFALGRGPLSARIYDKTRELPKRRKWWFRDVWARHGSYVEGEPVWRVEFQIRREVLRDLCDAFEEAKPREPGEDLEPTPRDDWRDWATLAARLGSLWDYLTHEWLRHGPRKADDRKAVSHAWAAVQVGWVDAQDVEAERRAATCAEFGVTESAELLGEVEVDVERGVVRDEQAVLTPGLGGYLTASAARFQLDALRIGKPMTTSEAVAAALGAAFEYTRRKAAAEEGKPDGGFLEPPMPAEPDDEPLLKRVAVRARQLGRRRQSLTGPPMALRAHDSWLRLFDARKSFVRPVGEGEGLPVPWIDDTLPRYLPLAHLTGE